MKTRINEIFASIQGEGAVVGYKQLFIRFCGCNLNCSYCDTDFVEGKEFSADELAQEILKNYNLETFHSISLTGGEPLLNAEFLVEFLPKIIGKTKIYLETNATCFDKLPLVSKYIDIIAADIKLKSASGLDTTDLHRKFFEQCRGIETFAKIVFDKNITDSEIKTCTQLAEQFNIELVLQPKMDGNNMCVNSDFCNELLNKFTSKYQKVRLIPQVHKFINVR